MIPDLSPFLSQRYKAHWFQKRFSTIMVQRWWHWGGPVTPPLWAFHLPEDVNPFQQCTFPAFGRAFPGHLRKHVLHFIRPGSLCSCIFQLRMVPFLLPYEGCKNCKFLTSVKNFPSYSPFISFSIFLSIYKFKTRFSFEKTTTKTIKVWQFSG